MDPVTIAKLIGVRRLLKIAGVLIVVQALVWFILFPLVVGAMAGASVDEEASSTAACTGQTPSTPGAVIPAGNVTAAAESSRWDSAAVRNAGIIAERGIAAGVGVEGVVVALATAMQESGIQLLTYGDRDSLSLFQQRPSTGWGTPEQIMDPVLASDAFYGVATHTSNPGLTDIAGWQQMSVTVAAQAVQRSGFPDAYAKWETEARKLAVAVLDGVDVSQVMCTPGEAVLSGDWAHPLAPARYTNTSPFGMRFHPIHHEWRLHNGQDMAAPTGTPLRAACTGSITIASYRGSAGLTTEIDCGGGVKVRYLHQNSIGVSVGQRVIAGSVIGELGNTGGSTGPHLHFVTQVGGTPVDPVPFMSERGIQL